MFAALRITICLAGAVLLVAFPACRRAPTAAPGPTAAPRGALTADGCRACDGLWGRHGLAQVQSCLCRVADGGKRCRDGRECQGDCLAKEEDPEVQVTDPGPPRRGYFVGRCSTHDHTFGCHRFVPDGALAAGAIPLDTAPDMLCVD